MTAAPETPSPAAPDTDRGMVDPAAGLGPAWTGNMRPAQPVHYSDPALPHQIIIRCRGRGSPTTARCNCGTPLGTGDADTLIRAYRQHTGIM